MAASDVSAAEQQEVNSYELFIAALSVISIVNIFLELFLVFDPAVANVILIVDTGLCVVFFADFLGRLRNAESKGGYFFRQLGWLDLLGSLPFPGLRIARVFRVARVVRLVRAVGMKTLINKVLHDRAGSALYTVLVLVVIVIQYGSIFELIANRHAPDANITTASDAVWYTIVTITTVGYGDRYPVTNSGRIVGVLIMVVGVGLFGVLTGFLANAFLAPKSEQPEEKALEQSTEPSPDQLAPQPASLPESVGLIARLDQLTAEVASLRRLLERLPVALVAGLDAPEASPDTHGLDGAQDAQ
jgi:voltage-gated potassium channel